MNKRLILVLALALVVGLTVGSAYAEVQNVKVSGDIYAAGVGRNHFDLTRQSNINNGANKSDAEADMFSIARLRVDADLTDNVGATIRLLNERNWNGDSTNAVAANQNITGNTVTGGTTFGTTTTANNLNIDLAYVTLKEFLYSPLTLKIGRQDLRFGNALIVGDPDTNIFSGQTSLAEGDLSARKSFDAVRATLDYNPLVIDGVYAKVQEGNVNLNDDVTLMGLNAAYDLNKSTTFEGYFFSKITGSQAANVFNVKANNNTSFNTTLAGTNIKNDADKVNVIGLRAGNKGVKNLSLNGEVAYQFGTYNPKFDPNAAYNSATDKAKTMKRSAWAVEVGANYDLKDVQGLAKYAPVVGAGYTYLSGQAPNKTGDNKYKGWDPMFEDQTNGHILNAITANTNIMKANFNLGSKLTDDIGLKFDYVMAWFAKKYDDKDLTVLSGIANNTGTANVFRMQDKKFLGNEFDLTLTYDYTEDVQFALLGGYFAPSKAVAGVVNSISTGKTEDLPKRAAACELIGSMKVTF